jgi:hypothetical protein
MTTIPVIDALDRCKIALQYLAERQSERLTVLLELLLEELEDAIGQAHAQLRQCRCQGSAQPRAASGAAPRGVLTLLPGAWQTSPPVAAGDAEALDAEAEGGCPDVSPRTAGTWRPEKT